VRTGDNWIDYGFFAVVGVALLFRLLRWALYYFDVEVPAFLFGRFFMRERMYQAERPLDVSAGYAAQAERQARRRKRGPRWSCPSCGALNDPLVMRCNLCNCERPSAQIGAPAVHVGNEYDYVPSQFAANQRWRCGYCRQWNGAERDQCRNCGASVENRILNSIEKAKLRSRNRKNANPPGGPESGR
jgi:hypothetical protein